MASGLAGSGGGKGKDMESQSIATAIFFILLPSHSCVVSTTLEYLFLSINSF